MQTPVVHPTAPASPPPARRVSGSSTSQPYNRSMSAHDPDGRGLLPRANPTQADTAVNWANRIGATVFIVVIGGVLLLLLVIGALSAFGG